MSILGGALMGLGGALSEIGAERRKAAAKILEEERQSEGALGLYRGKREIDREFKGGGKIITSGSSRNRSPGTPASTGPNYEEQMSGWPEAWRQSTLAAIKQGANPEQAIQRATTLLAGKMP